MANKNRPHAYKGVVATKPPQFMRTQSSPTVEDYYNEEVGTLWLNTTTQYATTPVAPELSDLYVLLRKYSNEALWRCFKFTDLASLTGDTGGVVFADEDGNVDILGTAGLTSTAGDPPTNTLVIDLDDSVPNLFSTGSGNATPAAHELEFVEGLGIVMAGATNLISFAADNNIATTYTTDAGDATAAANTLNIVGDGGNISTLGAADTITINSNESEILKDIDTDAGLATQVGGVFNLLGGTNANTAGSGNIATINGMVFGSNAFFAWMSSDMPNCIGLNTSQPIVEFDSVYFNVGNNFDVGTYAYTCPQDGTYIFFNTMTFGNLSGGMSATRSKFLVTYVATGLDDRWEFHSNNGTYMQSARGYLTFNGAMSIALSAGDTVQIKLQVAGGAADTAGVLAGTQAAPLSWFGGYALY